MRRSAYGHRRAQGDTDLGAAAVPPLRIMPHDIATGQAANLVDAILPAIMPFSKMTKARSLREG